MLRNVLWSHFSGMIPGMAMSVQKDYSNYYNIITGQIALKLWTDVYGLAALLPYSTKVPGLFLGRGLSAWSLHVLTMSGTPGTPRLPKIYVLV